MRNDTRLGVALALGVTALALLRHFDPATSGIFPQCPFHYLTGLYCPGCGSLRAIHQLLHANLSQAWAMNPLTVVMAPFLIYGLASEALFELRGQRLPEIVLPAHSIRALCVAIILFGVLRNLPLQPFDLLAPGGRLSSLSIDGGTGVR